MGGTTVASGSRMVLTSVVGAHEGGDPRVPRNHILSRAPPPPHWPARAPASMSEWPRPHISHHTSPGEELLGPPLAHPPPKTGPWGTREKARVAAPQNTPTKRA